MKKIVFAIIFCVLSVSVVAQDDADQLHENAKTFMRQGDFANATLILTRALQQAPKDASIMKDLSLAYYLQKENQKALDAIKPLIENQQADDQTYQLAATIYRALNNDKEAEKIYKLAIRQYPKSGGLYNDYGELFLFRHDPNAIKLWEQGIKNDPSFGGNYYNAAKFYNYKNDNVWTVLYGEIFVNIESFTARTAEMKDILLSAYKKLFADPDLLKNAKDKNAFEVAFLTCMNKQNSVVIRGISAETLTMIRTRFILDWNKNYAKKFPFRLFDYQEQLLETGLFPAYNQWIFGASGNLAAYQIWTSNHSAESEALKKFQGGRIFKVPEGQYYHN